MDNVELMWTYCGATVEPGRSKLHTTQPELCEEKGKVPSESDSHSKGEGGGLLSRASMVDAATIGCIRAPPARACSALDSAPVVELDCKGN